MSIGVETELKLRAQTDVPLEALALAARLGPAELGAGRVVHETDAYLDTADGLLAAAGWACRLRDRDGVRRVSLKGPPQHDPGSSLHRRPEVEGPVGEGHAPSAWPPSPARSLLLKLSAGRPLVERLALEQQRVERPVVVGGRRIGVLSLDRVRLRGHGDVPALRVVELELDAARVAEGLDTAALADALAGVPGLRPDPHTKLAWALAQAESGTAPQGAS